MTFPDFCAAHGLIMRDLILDRWVRVPTIDHPRKRNGAYRYLGTVGFVQNHATMTEVSTWFDESSTPADREAMQAKLAERRRIDQDRARAAMASARAFWASSAPLRAPHPYLERKGLRGFHGLRVHGDLLVVPVMGTHSLISVQTIAADGTKRFWPGAPVKGGHFALRRPRSAVTCLVEGLATGLAVYQSVPQASVIVAFNAGNLLAVADALKPCGSVVVCADNDVQTEERTGTNPGLLKASEVAEHIGCGIAYPKGIGGSDWADYLQEMGEGAATRMGREILAGARYVSGAAA